MFEVDLAKPSARDWRAGSWLSLFWIFAVLLLIALFCWRSWGLLSSGGGWIGLVLLILDAACLTGLWLSAWRRRATARPALVLSTLTVVGIAIANMLLTGHR